MSIGMDIATESSSSLEVVDENRSSVVAGAPESTSEGRGLDFDECNDVERGRERGKKRFSSSLCSSTADSV